MNIDVSVGRSFLTCHPILVMLSLFLVKDQLFVSCSKGAYVLVEEEVKSTNRTEHVISSSRYMCILRKVV